MDKGQLTFLEAARPARPLVIMSLRPEWHRRFANGTKSFEYRRRFITSPFSAAIYVSGTDRAISAFAEFDEPIIGRPEEIADIAESTEAGSGAGLREYFGDRPQALALPVVSYRVMPILTLAEVRIAVPGFQPPQAYAYLDKNPTLFRFIASQPEWSAALARWGT